VRTCGHERPPRRLCDLCGDASGPFLACSLACLEAHLAAAHGPDVAAAPARAAAYVARVNANVAGDRETFAGHRAHLLGVLAELGQGKSLGVLGAGNGSDLDLPALVSRFEEVHLVDLDGVALERCRAGLAPRVRARVHAHADVDLTGFLGQLDAWGEAFPAEAELGRLALPAIHGVLRQLGRRFDTVVSTCVLSQLAVPFHRAWVLPAASWGHLFAAIAAVHLATLAGALEPGGTGLLVFDVLSSKTAPELRALEGAGPGALAAFLAARASGGLRPSPDPEALLRRLQSPGMDRLAESPQLMAPWLWNIGAETQLVYGLAFRRPAPI
jgi:hypothetical protein